MSNFIRRIAWIALAGLLASSCSREAPPSTATTGAQGVRQFDPASVARGSALFLAHCAQCHGPEGQGHPDWQTPSNGSFSAAPPVNGTGHDWKRTRVELAAVIKNGARRKSDNADIMPPWKKRLNERDIDDILNWMQSLWPPDVYDRWHREQTAAAPPPANTGRP